MAPKTGRRKSKQTAEMNRLPSKGNRVGFKCLMYGFYDDMAKLERVGELINMESAIADWTAEDEPETAEPKAEERMKE